MCLTILSFFVSLAVCSRLCFFLHKQSHYSLRTRMGNLLTPLHQQITLAFFYCGYFSTGVVVSVGVGAGVGIGVPVVGTVLGSGAGAGGGAAANAGTFTVEQGAGTITSTPPSHITTIGAMIEPPFVSAHPGSPTVSHLETPSQTLESNSSSSGAARFTRLSPGCLFARQVGILLSVFFLSWHCLYCNVV